MTQTIQALESFVFSADEYYLHPAEVMHRAAEHVTKGTNCTLEELSISLVSEILRAKFRSILESRADWVTIPIQCDSKVSCRMDGVLFQGEARIEPKRIKVSLDDGGISRECLIHNLAPCIFTEEPFIGSPASCDGEACAKDLFLEICSEALLKNRIFASGPTHKQ